MKIDIHCHTRKIKSGDAPTRNIEPDAFAEILRQTEVKIFAVTNHNFFDSEQYYQMQTNVKDFCQVWPGIELDISENQNRSHLIVIANPKNTKVFGERVSKLIANKSPDTFTISLQDTVNAFDDLDCIYIAHYFIKKPSLSDADVTLLTQLVSNPRRVLKEATNALSAGIYISHGHNTIYGSDIQDWSKYIALSKELPDLRLPVESFEQFCFLLQRDEATINTILDKKAKETIQLALFVAAELINIDIYNDINILFGSKGTGKTAMLEKLSEYYNKKGYKTQVYKSNDYLLSEIFSLNKASVTASDLGVDECIEEIEFLKLAAETDVTTLLKYYQHFEKGETNKISTKLTIKSIEKADDRSTNRTLSETHRAIEKVEEFNDFITNDNAIELYVTEPTRTALLSAIENVVTELAAERDASFIESRSIRMLNHLVTVFKEEITKKTGLPPKPSQTGFVAYAENRIKIETATNKILKSISIKLQPREEYIGSLGEKGELYCQTEFMIQDGHFTDTRYIATRSIKRPKSSPKEFVKAIDKIKKNVYSNDLFIKITELNQIDGIDTIVDISCLQLFHKHFTLNGMQYTPSSGESSMILLHRELQEDKDIYLIDEPERSLGNDYINDVIVPLLKEMALLGKKVIIATHDANIAVRTLPYNSIYRLRDGERYYTMMGNPFSNKLKCVNKSRDDLDWKEISMKTLEGGKSAFGERGKIYGN